MDPLIITQGDKGAIPLEKVAAAAHYDAFGVKMQPSKDAAPELRHSLCLPVLATLWWNEWRNIVMRVSFFCTVALTFFLSLSIPRHGQEDPWEREESMLLSSGCSAPHSFTSIPSLIYLWCPINSKASHSDHNEPGLETSSFLLRFSLIDFSAAVYSSIWTASLTSPDSAKKKHSSDDIISQHNVH